MKIQSVRFFESVLLITREASNESREVTYISPAQCMEYGWEVHLLAEPVPHIEVRDVADGRVQQCVPLANVKHWSPLPLEVARQVFEVPVAVVQTGPGAVAHVTQNASTRPRKYPKAPTEA